MNDEIRHKGRIETISGEHVRVRIVQTSACLHCKIAGHCNSADSKEKVIDVLTKHAIKYEIGQEVVVVIGSKVGLKAVLLAFVLPVVIAMAVICVALNITSTDGMYSLPEQYSQGVAAAAGMLTFVLFYVGLYFFRDTLKGKFQFHIDEQ